MFSKIDLRRLSSDSHYARRWVEDGL